MAIIPATNAKPLLRQVAFPLEYARGVKGDEGYKAFVTVLDWSQASSYSFKELLRNLNMDTLASAYIDHSQVAAPLSVVLNGTYQNIALSPFQTAAVPIIETPSIIDFTVQCAAGAGTTSIFWLNKEYLPISFPSQPSSGLQGTQFAFTATGANAQISVTVPFIAGRTIYVTSLSATASGSTAGAQVGLGLTNISDNGVADVMSWTFVFPVGVLVAAQPIIQTFTPPLQGFDSGSLLFQLGPGGAGNTSAAINITGYYL